jgi:hypothetical protein
VTKYVLLELIYPAYLRTDIQKTKGSIFTDLMVKKKEDCPI